MKILIATGIFPPDIGGPATYAKTLIDELPRRGLEIKIVTYGEGPDEKRVNYVSRRQNILARYFKYFWLVYKLAPWADIIYLQGPVSEGLPGCLACQLRGRKYFLKIVGDYAWEQGRQRFGVKESLDDFQDKKYVWQVELMRKIQKIVAGRAKAIITPSQYLKKIILKWGISEAGIKVIYNSVEKKDLKISKEEVRAELGLSGEVVLSVGRLVPWKGFNLLIELLPELLESKSDIRLVIIGEGPDKRKLKAKSEKLEVADRVIFTGEISREKVLKYMRAADLFVLNTGYEGLPHVILEAMQMSLPVVAAAAGGVPEVVKNEQTGLLVDYNDKEKIKSSIMDLLGDKEKGEQFAKQAKVEMNKFSRELMIERTIEVLKS